MLILQFSHGVYCASLLRDTKNGLTFRKSEQGYFCMLMLNFSVKIKGKARMFSAGFELRLAEKICLVDAFVYCKVNAKLIVFAVSCSVYVYFMGLSYEC
jgi:hypothetical protein